MKYLLAILAFALISGCGFRPVYATGSNANYASGMITVPPIAGRSGYMLRRALQEELAIGLPNVTEPATLRVEVDENLTRLTFKPDGAASRSSVVANARYTLSRESGSLSGRSSSEVNFAVPDSPYGDISAQKGASDRAMRLLAKRIVDDLRLELVED
ncbi:LPS assembly lipoprotein LptE [Hyphomonas pacifica]|uniref:Lipoprotein n=1 Tax=Hyphomonas pacifica TaxID=1280941 RepID=A0A062U3E0_9PROT|nr:LPS assembly lipoprotein LptE [Hyphomonas pacifica]KCZ51134.1 hypothetical protein HY2_12420 [Hyphomonas pacifica]RAN33593.1 hypothetical protein HY3_12520 [Hyphomonas pacifica]